MNKLALPPLNALRAFEAAARLGSVTAAADISSTSPSDPNDATHGTNNNHASTTFNVLANGADLALTKIKRAKTATTGGNDTVVVAGNTSASDMRSTLTLKNNGRLQACNTPTATPTT